MPRHGRVTRPRTGLAPAPSDAPQGNVASSGAILRPDTSRIVEFRATIPVKAAAIDIHGETGARLTLEVADSDMGDFLPIVLLRGKRLRVTVKEDAG